MPIWFPFFPTEDRNGEAPGMVHTSKRTDSAKRQEGLCQAVPRMLLSPLSWDEPRKNPTIKLHSEHTKCSLIYCSSKTWTRIFIRRFWFLSRLERTLIWNYIFRSISARCSLDNLQKLFSVVFLSLVRALSLEIFSSAFYTWDFLGGRAMHKSYFPRPFPTKLKRDHLCTGLDFSEFSTLCQGFDQVKPLCRVHEFQQRPWGAGFFQKGVHHMVWVTKLMCTWQLSLLPLAGFRNDSSKVTT